VKSRAGRILPFAPRYFLASVVLLVVLVAAYAVSAGRRSQTELRAQLEQKGLALADVLEAGSQNAIRSNALMEEMIAQRLFDNARLVDELLAGPVDPARLQDVVKRNHLRRIDLLDREGRPWTPPERPPHGIMAGMMAHGGGPPMPGMRPWGSPMPGMHPGEPPPMMRYMWGRRWLTPDDGGAAERAAPAPIKERRFWEGSVFGVAVSARSFPGIIAVHANAEDLLDFRRTVGVERQIEELARQSGIASVALLQRDLTVLAHSDPARIGERLEDGVLARARDAGATVSGLVDGPGRARAFEVVKPIEIGGTARALLAIRFSTEPMERVWREDLRVGVVLGVAVLLVGALGLGLIFFMEHRHLAEVRKLETEMTRRERLAALGDVAAAFAHEVRNPLNAVSMGLQRLRAEFAHELTGESGRFVSLMQGEVRRLNAIVEQFLSLARPLPLSPQPLAVDELVRGLAALLEDEARAARVEVRLELPTGLPPLVADRDRLGEVLLNLGRNALQAMEGGGTLTLGAEARRDAIVLIVGDTGPGIAPDVVSRIFDPYFTTKPDGLGLGLAIARRIVEAHGGTIEVDTTQGRGARFLVRLPRE
jgi:two-component system sensor histidine kinase HydH